jgi:hypothetical protein
MDIVPFEDLKKFHFQNAKSFLVISFAISNWSATADDKNLPNIPKFELIKTFSCYDTYGFKYRKYGALYFSNELNMALISFSGTEFTSEWIDDFDCRQTNPSAITNDVSIFVHLQHYNIYNSFREDLHKSLKETINENTIVVCIGHSLGGSSVSICFFDIIINNLAKYRTLYTFGAPRTGNTEYANILTQEDTVMRVCNTADLTISVPPPIINKEIFTHYGGEKVISFTKNLNSYTANHCDAYTQWFEEKVDKVEKIEKDLKNYSLSNLYSSINNLFN